MIKIKDRRIASQLFPKPLSHDVASKNDVELLQSRLSDIEAALIKPTPLEPIVHKSVELKGTVQRDDTGKIVSITFPGDKPIKASVQRDPEGKLSGVVIAEHKKTLLTEYLT